MVNNNTIILEERVTCGKIKSYAKTFLIGEINNNISLDENNNENKINTIKLLNIQTQFDNSNYNNIELVKSSLIDSTIIISSEPNPKSSDTHILVFPGYLAKIKKISENKLNIDIYFNNFFPFNIPLNQNKLYFIIWFKKIIPSNIIIKTTINYEFNKLELTDLNTLSLDDKYILVQQTQTLNVISKAKLTNKIIKSCCFENLSRGFWIKMLLSDYYNLKEIKLLLNNQDRITLTIYQIELMGITQFIENNSILIFLNLEFDNNDWNIPLSNKDIIKIYSNSLNCSRIDNIKFIFEFNTNYINSDIKITSLSLNCLNLISNTLKYKYF